jgi:hypothetical protein
MGMNGMGMGMPMNMNGIGMNNINNLFYINLVDIIAYFFIVISFNK